MAEENSESVVDKVKRHPVVSISSLVLGSVLVTAATTWTIADRVAISPRDFEIQRLNGQLGDLPTRIEIGHAVRIRETDAGTEITVMKAELTDGQSAISSDGNVAVRVGSVGDKDVSFDVTVLSTGNQVTVPSLPVGYSMKFHWNYPVFSIDYKLGLVSIENGKALFTVTRYRTGDKKADEAKAEAMIEDKK